MVSISLQNFIFRGHLGDGEKIIAVAHRHVCVALAKILKTSFFGVLIPFVIYLFFPQVISYMIVWGLIGLFVLHYHFYDWYFDAWLMTNQALLDVEWNGFFDRTSTRIEYHMIEGISYEISGFWQMVLGYGVVTLEKIGSGTLVQLTDVYKPKKVEQQLLKCQKQFVTQKAFREHGALKDLLAEMVIGHVQEHGLPDVLKSEFNDK